MLQPGGPRQPAVEQRPDVLVFSSEPLDEPVEVIGDVTAELHVTRDNPDADLFVRLCDVDPPGDAKSRSRNVCDGIVRLTGADPLAGTVRASLIGAAHRFGRGHRLRLQVAGAPHPRFARNPGNGQVDAPASYPPSPTRYEIGLSAQAPSALLLAAAMTHRNGDRSCLTRKHPGSSSGPIPPATGTGDWPPTARSPR